MLNINTELRQSYYSLLAGNILIDSLAVPIYYGQAPINDPAQNPLNYVLINTISSTHFNDDTFNYTNTIIQLMIVTKAIQNNNGLNADSIAGQILPIIIPNPRDEIVQIVSGYVANTVLYNDIVQSGLNDGQLKVLNRILMFYHKIRHYPYGTQIGNIYYGVQDTNADPVDFTHMINQNHELPITIDYGIQANPKFYWLAIPSATSDKTNWYDINASGNQARIGASTDLYEIRGIVIGGDAYDLYMTRYLTGFNGVTSIVRYDRVL
jgi:hypothetical protein